MLNPYPMSVILSATTGRMLTSIKVAEWRGLEDLYYHLDANPETVAAKVLEQHPELDVDVSNVEDWPVWVEEMRQRFGDALKFEGCNS